MTEKQNILDIGCGRQKIPNAIGIDFNEGFGDIVHDLNVFPYPLDDELFDEIYIMSTLCLLNDPVKVMEEVWRLGKPNCRVVIQQPYFRSVWNFVDPWMKNFGTVHSFAFYDPDDLICQRYSYSSVRFKTDKIEFLEYKRTLGLMKWFANHFPRKYEIYLSHLFPMDIIVYNLRKI